MNRSTAFWLLTSVGLIGAIMLQVDDDMSLTLPVTAATVEPGHRQDDDSGRSVVGTPNSEWRDVIVERPLFSISRKPFSPAVEEEVVTADQEVEPLTLTLSGTLLAGEARIALLAHPTHGLLRLRQGQTIDGWQVDEIRKDEVSLRRAREVALLSLRKDALGSSLQKPPTGRAAQNR